MLQTLPANSLRKSAQQWIWESITLSGAEGLLSSSNETAKSRRIELNKSLRKFLVADKVRLACFFGNATQETQWYQKFHEASSYWYAPWDGRGLLQLTHASNYLEYWKFQGRPIDNATKSILELHTTQANNNRPIIQGQKSMNDPTHSLSDTSTGISSEIISRRNNTKNAYEAAHSAGAYWAWSKSAMQADSYLTDSSSTLKTVQTTQGNKRYYENLAFGKVAATVNIGHPATNYSLIWGIQARFMAFTNSQFVLLDNVQFKWDDGSLNFLPQDFSRREIQS